MRKDTILFSSDTLISVIDSTKMADSIVLTGKVIKGIASFYSANLDGTKTATGEIFRNSKFTGASNNLKLNTWVKVTNLKNGKTVVVRINDRMHPNMKKKGRVIDLSRAAAKKLDFIENGLTKVKLEVIDNPKK
jgi:rare lipoprotein A